jgi:uncharacterized protein (TIGR00251 family)
MSGGAGHWAKVSCGFLVLQLRVQPRGKCDAVLDLHDGRLRIQLNAPPVDDKANEALKTLLAREFGVPRQSVKITQGEKSPRKTVSLPLPGDRPAWFTRLETGIAAAGPSL